MRKFALLLTIGLFLTATTANASDGDKVVKTKGKKAHCTCSHKTALAAKSCCPAGSSATGASAKCPKGSCAKHASATGTSNSSSTTAPKTTAAKS